MAEKNNKNKFDSMFDRFISMVESVSEDSYEDHEETDDVAEVTEFTEPEPKLDIEDDFFDFSKEYETVEEEVTRKIDSGKIADLLEINVNESAFDEKENTMVFKTAGDDAPAEGDGQRDKVEETHVFKKLVEDDYENENEKEPDDFYEPRDFRKIRRNRHYRMGCMGGFMYFLVVVCISVALASVGWLAANDVLSLNKELVSAEITVAEDFTIEEIAQQLEDKGIIEYSFLFKVFSKISTAEEKITPGTYTLSSHLDYRAIVTNLKEVEGPLKTVKVTIPEGRNMMETFRILEENGVCDVDVLLECATNYEFDYHFLNPDKLGTEKRLEGFLFPD